MNTKVWNKQKKKKKYKEQQRELIKHRDHFKDRTTSKAPAPQGKKLNLAISSLTKKDLLVAQRKSKKKCYYDVSSDYGDESGDEFNKSDSDSTNEEIVKKKKNP